MSKKVAIVGHAFRFPGSTSANYWQNLLEGRDLVTQVEEGRWSQEAFGHPDKANPGTSYTFAAGSIGDISGFDAGFFGISPREAGLMDPQQRLLLELAWEAVENAGTPMSSLRGSNCGVYVGLASVDYGYRMANDMCVIDSSVGTGNTGSISANRLSYVYDLRGPSMMIDTACSSSLVAFHQACRAIESGEIDLALAGGVSLHVHPYGFLIFSKASMLSRRGRCNVFDEAGDGYVRAEGGGLFLLKDYDQAIKDGDRILAVVAGSSINSDGRKSGLTVPSADAQASLMRQAYERAGIAAEQVDYLEAHGTGTAVGDPIESRAIGQALGQQRDTEWPLLIGSVKSNMGHLETASGVAGLTKAMYCLINREVPATIGIKKLNPNIPFEDLNLKVVTENVALKPTGMLTIGVNSFGFGGANAHVILQSHEVPTPAREAKVASRPLPLVISAKDDKSLAALAGHFADFLSDPDAPGFYDIAYHALFRRELHPHRAVLLANDAQQASQALRAFAEASDAMAAPSKVEQGKALVEGSGPVFVYSGNGSQWLGMGRRLLADSIFNAAISEIDGYFRPLAGYSLLEDLAGAFDHDGRYSLTEIAQPALFAVQVGVTRMLAERGVRPQAVYGHSVGEVAAAWACGALDLATATQVIYQRSRLQALTRGSGEMSAVGLSGTQTAGLLRELGLQAELCVAGENSHRGATVAGSPQALARLEQALNERQIFVRRLDLAYAFHSPAMDPIREELVAVLQGIEPQPSKIPFFSTVTGELLAGEHLDAEYWWKNIRFPVLFQGASEALVEQGFNSFVEVGPHPILRGYVSDALAGREREGRVVPTLLRNDDLPERINQATQQLLVAGTPLDWDCLFPCVGNFVELPGYAFQREHYWHETTSESDQQLQRRRVHPLLGYALPDQALTWENRLDTQLYPTLADHVVGEVVLFPGAGFTELALAAALQYQPGAHAEVEELEIRAPLLLNASPAKKIRVRIDASDGSVTIASRTYGQDEPWILHAVARVRVEARGHGLSFTAPAVPLRPADLDAQAHLALTRAAGLHYGPAYRAIDAAWIDGEQVIARLRLPLEIASELETLHLHPALLDCAFQLITPLLRDSAAVSAGLAFIPVKLGRITFTTQAGVPMLVQVQLLRRSAHSLLADFTLFDEMGQAVVCVREARFRGVRLHNADSKTVSLVGSRAVARPLPGQAPAPLTVLPELAETLQRALQAITQTSAQQRYAEEVDPLLDSLCGNFLNEAVLRQGGSISTERKTAWARGLPVGYVDQLIRRAQQEGLLNQLKTGEWEAEPSNGLTEAIWQELFRSYPEYFQIVHAVGRVGMHMDSLLEGRMKIGELLPREATPAQLARQILGAAGHQALVGSVREHIGRLQQALPAGRRLRILELGLGGAAFAGDLGGVLDFNCTDYRFCSATLEGIEHLREEFPLVEWLDLGEASRHPALPGEVFDLVLVPTDFAPMAQVRAALAYAGPRLAEEGALLLLSHYPTRWADFLFGADPDWWHSSPSQTLLSAQATPSFWQHELQCLGLTVADSLDFLPQAGAGSYVLLATPGAEHQPPVVMAVPPQSWLLVAGTAGEEGAYADRLVVALQASGQAVVRVEPDEAEDLGEALLRLEVIPAHVLLLSGLFASDREASQTARCLQAATLVNACETVGIAPDCWLLTRGGMATISPADASASLPGIADAVLWGFGRTLANESGNCRIRLLDLQGDVSVQALLPALLQAGDETEMAIDAAGHRYVPRLEIEPEHVQESSGSDAAQVSLGFELPGQLRNLRWEAQTPVQLATGDLAVDVQATGLNFRDVMYALGLLSDEAIENGFSGPTLGFEFAGVVLEKGSEVLGDFAVGDRVVGFGPASFANRLVTSANAVARIPAGMSFEAAATIPSTFFTVYYALHHLARLEPGEKVLIHGAAGGVGIAAIQIAQWLGAEIHATAGSDEKRDFLRLLGIEHVYDSRSLVFADEILDATNGRGVDVVLNSLAGEAINRNLDVLRPFGRFLELGKRDFYENTKIGLRPFRNNISYFGIDADQLMSERPALTRRLFGEMMALFEGGTLSPLPYHGFDANQVVEAFRYMQQARQIGKIVVTYRNGIRHVQSSMALRPSSPALALAADATYLVTGGLSGFGLRTAQWLIERGARHLVLLGRRGPATEEAQPYLADWRSQGLDVRAEVCDITDRSQLTDVLADIADGAAPLRGIVHAATVFEDGLIRGMTADQLQRVLAPKARGAALLHELTEGLVLDFFVLFSSATTLFGNPGQANYVAANHWLEALARYRLSRGLPATCVLWGAIDDAGFLARNTQIKEALQGRMGGAALPASVALATLEALLLERRSGLGVLELDWKALSRFLPTANAPRFEALAGLQGGEPGDETDSGDIRTLLETLSEEELHEAFCEMLKQEVGEILRLSPAKLENDRPLQEMGLDSLMGVEMAVAVEARFGVRLPVMALSESATIAKLARRIIDLLRAEHQASEGTEPDEQSQLRATVARHAKELLDEAVSDLQEDIRDSINDSPRLIR